MAHHTEPSDAEFDRLISQYFEGMLTGDELSAFEQRVLGDEQFAERFAAWCLMHRQILDLETEDRLHLLMDQFVTALPGPPRTAIAERAVTLRDEKRNESDGSARWHGQRSSVPLLKRFETWAVATLAMAGVVAVLAFGWFDRRGDSASNAATDMRDFVEGAVRAAANSQDRSSIASITRIVEPVWAPGAVQMHHGQQLARGSRVRLDSGLAKVTFHCGAEVAIEGPCDFEVQAEMVGMLRSGKMTADVPRRAFAFAILCPGVEVVDLGTSFGVAVDASGETELHVFEGEVLCNRAPAQRAPTQRAPTQRERAPAGIHVPEGKAMRFGSQRDDPSDEPSDIPMNEAQFAGLISLRQSVDRQPRALTPNDLALWLSADIAVITDEQHRVPCWPDIVYGENVSAEDAIQANGHARPRLIENAVHGMPAVRFDGESDFLLTTPLETTDNQTVLLVCQFSQTAFDKKRIWGGQIVNYDGPPNRYLSTTLEPGVLQIGEPLLAHEFKPSLLTSQVFAGFIGSATVEAGRVDAHQIGADVPVVVAYRYDFANKVAEMWINGRSSGTALAFAPQEITSRKIIGRHAWMQLFFRGDLAELLIYNKALSPDELNATTAYLAEKYSIAIEPPADPTIEVRL